MTDRINQSAGGINFVKKTDTLVFLIMASLNTNFWFMNADKPNIIGYLINSFCFDRFSQFACIRVE